MAKCTLDLSHPNFQKCLGSNQNSPAFMDGLRTMKSKVEAEHTSCHWVVQPMPGYPHCSGKIWKYDWSPTGQRSSTRKSWRLIVIVPDPHSHPLRLIAAGFYDKASTAQLSNKELALTFAKIVNPDTDPPASDSPAFHRVEKSDGSTVSICRVCGETAADSKVARELDAGEESHKRACTGPITA